MVSVSCHGGIWKRLKRRCERVPLMAKRSAEGFTIGFRAISAGREVFRDAVSGRSAGLHNTRLIILILGFENVKCINRFVDA